MLFKRNKEIMRYGRRNYPFCPRNDHFLYRDLFMKKTCADTMNLKLEKEGCLKNLIA